MQERGESAWLARIASADRRSTPPTTLRRRLVAVFFCWLIGLLPLGALAADPQIAQLIDDPDPVPAGGLYSYQLRVDNNAAEAANNTRLRITVPAGATFVSASPASQNCAPTSATQIDCNLGTLGGLGADVRNINFTWRATGPGPATVNATALVSADNDINAGNNTQNATTTVISGANLSLAKSGAPNPVVGGANVTYTLTAANAGPNAGGNIVITDNLPPAVSFVSASGSGWTCSHAAGVVTCSRAGPHAVGAAIPALSIAGTVNASGGTITNSASIAPAASGGIADPDSGNNTVTADNTVLAGADVRIAQKTVTSSVPAVAGSNVTFQIQPRNGGPAAAVNAVVTDTLPAGWTFVSATGPNWTCGNSAQVVTCSRANLPMGAADNITVIATAPDNAAVGPTGTTYTNTAAISSATADPIPGNNSGAVNVSVLPDGADLRTAKSKTPDPVAKDSNLTSTITVTNNGPRTATGPLRVVEVLNGETFVSASGSGWSCAVAGNVVTCDHANGAPGLAVGASLPTLTIVSTATSSGVVSNTACTGNSLPAGAGAVLASPPIEGDPNPTNDCAATNATSTTVQPDLRITKTTTTPTGGDKVVSTTESSVTYSLVVTNNSLTPQNATGVRISDTVPAFIAGRTTISAPVVAGVSAGTATFNCSVVGATVTCTQSGGVLATGQSVTVPITVNRPLQDGTFTNTASVSNSAEGDPNGSNNSASDTVTIDPIADVEMTGKTSNPGTVRAGENSTYVMSFRNNGPSIAQGVVVSDAFTFPAGDSGVTVVSITSSKSGSVCSVAAGAQLTPAASSFSCTIGSLANAETQTVTLVVRPNYQPGNAARVFNNTASVTTTTVENPAGGDNGNNSRSAVLDVSPAEVDLLVNKTDIVDPVPYTAGATFISYRVRVTSNGPSFATNVRVNEVMTPPAGKRIRFVCDTTTAGGSTCNPAPLCSVADVSSAPGVAIPTFACSVPAGTTTTGAAVGTLASGQSKDIFLRFEALDQPLPTGDIFTNAATVLANEPDTFAANDTESEATTTRQRIDLRVSKSANPATVTLRQPFNWIVNVVNNGPGHSLQTDLTDTLPAGVIVTGPITWTRTLQAGNGTCTINARVVSCALGQLDATGSATITIPVRIDAFPSGGTRTNSATVDVDPTKTGGIDTPGGNNTGNSTVNVTRSSISGTVFEDRDRSGSNAGTPQVAATEPRIAGVSLRLTGTDAYGNAVDLSVTTDADGNYSFNDLPPANGGGYTITQTQPAGYNNGPVNPPAAGAGAPTEGGTHAAGGASGNSSYSAIVLGGNNAGTGYNFPELRRPSLSGFVYIDVNANGVRDAGTDQVISGATVRLLNAATLAVVATTTTNGSGAYSFTNLDPLIAYVLEQPLPSSPAGLANGPVNPGLIDGAACAAGCTAQPDTPAAGADRIAAIDLSSGTDGTLFNFGERQQTSIAGLVWVDTDRNGALGGGETNRLAGVTIRLVQGADCASGTTLQTTTTGADGSYRFDNVIAFQNYLVCQTQPAGYGTGTANSVAGNAIAINALPAAGSVNNNFGETLGSIAGSVYQDSGGGVVGNFDNGARDTGEAGITGVPVTLTGTDILGHPVSRSTVTDALGNFTFDNLIQPDGNGYTVTEGAIPAAAGSFLDGRETAGTRGGSTAVNDVVSGIALPAGGAATGYLFGELPVSTISGTVFVDLNDNGSQNLPGDLGLGGVTIQLTGTEVGGAPVSRSTTTAADGTYSFANLRPGTYSVTEPTQPAGTTNGKTIAGTAGGSATTPAVLPSAISGIVMGLNGGSSAGNNFAEIPSNSSISGRIWLDTNNDGVVDAGESGIAGVTVELTGTDTGGNPVSRTTTTDASGAYRFDQLAPGSYAVREPTQPAGTLNGRTVAGSTGGTATAAATQPSVISTIPLALGQDSSGHNFGEIGLGSIAGNVWADNNDNGTIDTGESGIAGVTITLSGTDDLGQPVSQTTTTAADGSWRFANLRPGTYTVTEPAQPGGTVNGKTVAGTSGGTASAAAVAPSAIAGIVLAPGGQSQANNFGEIGQSPDLWVSKRHSPATFTVANPGSYTISVRNVGQLPTVGAYTVSDRLPAGLTLAVAPAGNGWTCTGAVGASSFSCTASTVIAAGAIGADTITATVQVAVAAANASPVDNGVLVEGGGEVDARRPSNAEREAFNGQSANLPLCATPPAGNACREPTPVQRGAVISGTAWLDLGTVRRLLDPGDRRLPGWVVEVVDPASGRIVATTTTGADGAWRIADLVPGVAYAVRFRDPVSAVVFGNPVNGETAPGSSGVGCDHSAALSQGTASSCVGSGPSSALSVVLAPNQELTQQSLPVDPSGVVYDSGLRTALPGATVSLAPSGACPGWDPTNQIVGATLGGYTINGGTISMTVGANGLYQFLFGPNAPASCTFSISVVAPSGYTTPSALIPPQPGTLSPPGGPTVNFAVQPSAAPPTGPIGPATNYWLLITAGSGVAGIVNNHVAVDPAPPTGLSLTKTGDRTVAEIGDTVRYTITVQLNGGALPRQTTVVDRLPQGFTYVRGTAIVDGVPIADPTGAPGPTLAFNLGPMGASNRLVLQYRVRVGVGSQQGDGLNRARAHACGVPAGCVAGFAPLAGSVATNEGQHRVRVSGGVFATEACVLGKVFVDCNGNHVQDPEELGVPGVRLVLSEGTTLISDAEGKYSVCGLLPRSHVLRIDALTLPRGSRLTTSSNRNLGDAGSLWLDLKNGELHRADFIEGSCSNSVQEQVKARRAQGEVRAPETEKPGRPALRFDSKAHQLDTLRSPAQGTDGANQRLPKPRASAPGGPGDEQNLPTPDLPMNRPPPVGRDSGAAAGGDDASR